MFENILCVQQDVRCVWMPPVSADTVSDNADRLDSVCTRPNLYYRV